MPTLIDNGGMTSQVELRIIVNVAMPRLRPTFLRRISVGFSTDESGMLTMLKTNLAVFKTSKKH